MFMFNLKIFLQSQVWDIGFSVIPEKHVRQLVDLFPKHELQLASHDPHTWRSESK